MGSGSDSHVNLARPLGQLIAHFGCHLLTGGGSGVMAEVSRAFTEVRGRQGLSIGIIRSEGVSSLEGEANQRDYLAAAMNRWVEVPIFTHLPLSGRQGTDFMSRNHINVLTADLLIALPGATGTYSEVQLGVQYRRRVVLFLGQDTIDGYKSEYFGGDPQISESLWVARDLNEVQDQIETCVNS